MSSKMSSKEEENKHLENFGTILPATQDELKTLYQLWIDGAPDNVEEEISKLKEEIIAPILLRISKAKLLHEQLRDRIKLLEQKALEQTLSLDIQLSSVQPSTKLNLNEQLKQWDTVIKQLENESSTRKDEITKLFSELSNLCLELEKQTPKLLFPDLYKARISEKYPQIVFEDLSVNKIVEIKKAIKTANDSIENTKSRINELKKEIIQLLDDLQIPNEKREANTVDKFSTNLSEYYYRVNEQAPTLQKTIIVLEKRHQELSALVFRLFGGVKDLMPKISTLWNDLEIPKDDPNRFGLWKQLLSKANPSEEEQNRFLIELPTVTKRFPLNIIEACESEYERLKSMQAAILKKFFEKEKATLSKLWDDLHFTEEQRSEFKPYFTTDYTKENLELIRDEIKRLELLYTTMSPLLKQIERREWIKAEMKRFELTASDPNRFKGSSTRLLEEEKFRKIVAKEFPKLTTSLRKLLVKWEKEHGGEAFYYAGEPYIETMNKEEHNPNFDLLHLRLLTNTKTVVPQTTSGVDISPSIASVAVRTTKPVARKPRPQSVIIERTALPVIPQTQPPKKPTTRLPKPVTTIPTAPSSTSTSSTSRTSSAQTAPKPSKPTSTSSTSTSSTSTSSTSTSSKSKSSKSSTTATTPLRSVTRRVLDQIKK